MATFPQLGTFPLRRGFTVSYKVDSCFFAQTTSFKPTPFLHSIEEEEEGRTSYLEVTEVTFYYTEGLLNLQTTSVDIKSIYK